MIILGISASHDGTLTIFKDGKNYFSIAEERLNRIKAYTGFPFMALRYIIENEIISANEIDAIAIDSLAGFDSYKAFVSSYAFVYTEDKMYYDTSNDSKPKDYYVNDEEYKKINDKESCILYVKNKVKKLCNEVGIHAPIYIYDHHLNHAAAAYYTSGFKDALVVTMDGQGDKKSATINVCKNGYVETISSTDIHHSAGSIYSTVTRKLGFKCGRHEGKITGLAAYGDWKKTWKCFSQLLNVRNGRLEKGFDLNYDKLIEKCEDMSREDLSASIQHLVEVRVLEIINYWIDKTGMENLALGGGIFANVKYNQLISEIPKIKELYIYPDMGDGGNAFGAAANLYYETNKYNNSESKLQTVYFGPEFNNDYIKRMLDKHTKEIDFHLSENMTKETAKLLANNKIIGWFQGRMEYGPRALGNRSILASPTDTAINKWLNERMKRNEFMPFAPSCLYEYADDLFDIPKKSIKFPAQFMTIAFNVKDKWVKKAPAVVHVDKTARPQLVRKQDNEKYYELLKEYYNITKLPLIVNTSFNIHEEPIVCKPEEGLTSLLLGVIDYFVCGDYICKLSKKNE